MKGAKVYEISIKTGDITDDLVIWISSNRKPKIAHTACNVESIKVIDVDTIAPGVDLIIK